MEPYAECEDAAVSVHGGADHPQFAPSLPTSIWVVAWASLAAQVVVLAGQGFRVGDEESLFLSVGLGALLVGYVSAGVVRARTVRLGLAWFVLGLGFLAELLALFTADDLGQVAVLGLSLAATAVALAGLVRFCGTEWFAWQRTKPPARDGAAIGRLVAMGVLVGVLGGLLAPGDGNGGGGIDVQIRAADR